MHYDMVVLFWGRYNIISLYKEDNYSEQLLLLMSFFYMLLQCCVVSQFNVPKIQRQRLTNRFKLMCVPKLKMK